jgi:serine/threonine protein kinase
MLHADLEALVGAKLHERYRVDSLLGTGGMGAVFKGHHVGLGRDVAIKVLHPEFGRDPSVGKRFEREATSASRLDHPNCVRVTDFGTTETGTTYLVMELLSGTELKARLGQPWAAQAMIATAKQMLAGLEHAHHFGVVHRDLKPENVYVTKDYRGDEVVKLVDFGIAKLLDEQGVEKLTRQGVVFGTPRYMSPEQAAGGKIDERTDLYAAGLIFYEMLAGHGPFEAEDTAQVLRMQIMAPPPPLPDSVPAPLAKVVEKLLEKSKADRYAHARDVIAALDEVAAVLISTAAASDSLVRVGAVSPSAARSGAAWQPAPAAAASVSGIVGAAGSVTGGHRTLSYDGSNYVATRTGSHSGVGQMSTGQYETLASGAAMAASSSWTGSHVSLSSAQAGPSADAGPSAPELSAAGVSRPIPIVTVEPIERRPPPPARRTWLPWAIAGSATVLVLVAVVVLVSMALTMTPTDDAPTAGESNTAGPPATKAGDTPNSSGKSLADPEQPVPGPTRTTKPSSPARQSTSDSRSSSTPAKKTSGDDAVEANDSAAEPAIIKSDDPPADSKPSNEPTRITDPPSGSDQPPSTDPPSDTTDPSGTAGDDAELTKREAAGGKGKAKGKLK